MKEPTTWILLAATLVAAFVLWRLAREDSFTVDERPHLAAGYAYLHHGSGRLNPEHPPLLKLLAALPVRDIDLPRALFERAVSPQELQYEAGRQILDGDYGRSRRIIRRARLAPILLTLALAWSVYGLGRKLSSAPVGLLAALFTLASPLVLAHGHLVTTDVAAALGCVLATWTFLQAREQPTRGAIALAAGAFGLAQLIKFSALLLIPFFALLAWRKPKALLAIPLGYLLIVLPCYVTLSRSYPHTLQQNDIAEALRQRPGLTSNLTTFLAQGKLTAPLAQYTLGVALAMHRVTQPARYYFAGRNQEHGSRWYFPLVYLWKEPLPALAFALGALARIKRNTRPLLLFVALYTAVTLASELHIGARHLLPVYPFLFLAAAEAWLSQGRRGAIVAAALLAWNVAETARAYPNLLAYTNPFGGGTMHGYRNVVDSNYDWGQDLERLRLWSLTHPGLIALDYFGGDNPGSALGGRVVGWWSARGDARASEAHYLAISVHQLQTALHPASHYVPPEDRYAWLTAWRDAGPPNRPASEPPPPDHRVGATIFVYDLRR